MIGVVGLGIVGLTTALGFAHKGYKVYGFDINNARRNRLRNNKLPFYEPFLGKFLKKYNNKNFFVCDTLKDVLSNADIIFYCVATPIKANGKINLEFLKLAIKDSLKFIIENQRLKTLVIRSTTPSSVTQGIVKPLIKRFGFKPGYDIGLANNPEFLRVGYAWRDFIKPGMIVIGDDDKRSGDLLEKIYRLFDAPIFRVSLNTSEFIKCIANAFLANLISFSNEMSMIAEAIGGIDIANSFKILHRDKRWSGMPAKMTNYIYPGCGFGGSCLPKDTSALYMVSKHKGFKPLLLKEVLSLNKKIKRHFFKKIINEIKGDERIGILGLSFKPNSDDVRETPAKDIIEMLIKKNKRIIAYDPLANKNFKKVYHLQIKYVKNLQDVLSKCELIVVLTAWDEFRKKKKLFKNKRIIDGRYFL